MTDEEMEKLAILISKQKIKDVVSSSAPRTVENPGVYFGALMMLKYLKSKNKIIES